MKAKYFAWNIDQDAPTIYAVYPDGYASWGSYNHWSPPDNASIKISTNAPESWTQIFTRWSFCAPVTLAQARTWYPNIKSHKRVATQA